MKTYWPNEFIIYSATLSSVDENYRHTSLFNYTNRDNERERESMKIQSIIIYWLFRYFFISGPVGRWRRGGRSVRQCGRAGWFHDRVLRWGKKRNNHFLYIGKIHRIYHAICNVNNSLRCCAPHQRDLRRSQSALSTFEIV